MRKNQTRTAPALRNTQDHLLAQQIMVAEGIAKMFAPFVETVVHDYRKRSHSVVAVFGNLTGRRKGAPLTSLGRRRVEGEDVPDLLVNYPGETPDGRPLKCCSVALRDHESTLIGALCINFELSQFRLMSSVLTRLTETTEAPLGGSERFGPQSAAQDIREEVERVLVRENWVGRTLVPEQRDTIIRELWNSAIFSRRGAVVSVAKALGVTRAAVYNDLKRLTASGSLRTGKGHA